MRLHRSYRKQQIGHGTLGPTHVKALSTMINYNQLSAPLRVRRYASLQNHFLPYWASGA